MPSLISEAYHEYRELRKEGHSRKEIIEGARKYGDEWYAEKKKKSASSSKKKKTTSSTKKKKATSSKKKKSAPMQGSMFERHF